MNSIIFEPISSSAFSAYSVSFFIAILAAVAIWLLRNNKTMDKNYRSLFSMLAFFALTISLGSTLMSWYFGERIGKVTLTEHGITSAYGQSSFEDIDNILISIEQPSSIIMPQVGNQSGNKQLVIFYKDGNRQVFTEAHYPIQKMIGPMRKALKRTQKKGSSK